MGLTLDELIERLKNTAFNISAITIDTDGSVHNNEKLTWEDTERIIKILEQYDEIQDCVKHQKEPYEEPNYTSISTGYATYTAEDIRTCDYCKHHNNDSGETLHCACRDCINFNRWEKVDA